MSSDSTPLTLSREDLYELVWSKPMVELAKDFGLSDVALAKRCRKLGVPVPGRGYWARVEAGQTPRQAPLKKRDEKNSDYYSLTFNAPQDDEEEVEKPPLPAEHNALVDRIIALELPTAEDLRNASPAIKRTAAHLKLRWRNEINWNRGERSGPIIQIEVSELVVDRALRICEQLLQAAHKLGWEFQAPPSPKDKRPVFNPYATASAAPPVFGHLVVEGEQISFRMDERRRQVDHVLSEEDKRRKKRGEYVYEPRWDLVPTGDLRLHQLMNQRYSSRTWKDGVKSRLEDQVKSVLTGFLDEAMSIKIRREQDRIAEIEHQKAERLRRQRSERREAHAELIHELERQAGAWYRARMLRAYVRSMRRALIGQAVEANLQGTPVDFIEWAEHYVNQMDPLNDVPHDSDLKEDRSGYYRDEEKLNRSLARLTGLDWQEAWKLNSPIEGEPRATSSIVIPDDEQFEDDD